MQSFATVFRFELSWQLRTPLFWSLCALYFLVHFVTQGTDNITIGEFNYQVHLNSPYQVLLNEGALAFYGLMPIMVFLVTCITRDHTAHLAEILFVQPLQRTPFLVGRFLGGLVPALLVALAGVIGNAVSLFMPWIDPERLAPFTPLPQFYSYFVLTLPYVFVTGACIFAVAALTRSAALALGAAVVFVAINLTLAVYVGLYAPQWLGLLDPSGAVALMTETRLWSVAQLNALYPVGLLPFNRLIWLVFALAVLMVTCWRYRFNIQEPSLPVPRLFGRSQPNGEPAVQLDPVAGDYSWRAQLAQCRRQLRMDAGAVLRSPLLFIVAGLIIVAAVSEHGRFVDALNVPTLPVTSLFTGFFNYGVGPYALILVIYFSGELVFRERERGVHEIIAATPYANWIMPLSKTLALCLMVTTLLFAAMLSSMVLQAAAGYTRFEIGLYLEAMFLFNGNSYFMFAAFAVLVQSVMPNKWTGFAVLTAFCIFTLSMTELGMQNVLYIPFVLPRAIHSDIAGFGPMQGLVVSLNVYWGFLTLAVFVLAVLLFPRGYYAGLRGHLRDARARASQGAVALGLVALLGFAATGSFIYYNTHILNDYQTSRSLARRDASYETTYGDFENRPAPNFTSIDMQIDIFPAERRLELRGNGLLENTGDESIHEFVLSPEPGVQVNELRVEGAEAVIADIEQGYFLFAMNTPLPPGATTTAHWDITRHSRGFANSIQDVSLLENGTYIDGRALLPAPGYRRDRELASADARRRHGLGPADRLPPLGDPDYLDVVNAGVGSRALMNTVISTSLDQIAVVPGELVRDWVEDGRRYFNYRITQPAWPAVSISSGRFEVASDQWNDVLLEVYYDAKHPYNVQTLLDTAKLTLDYYSEEFSPYQIPFFRIVEYPRYRSALTAFYGTIPYSEAVGFVSRPQQLDNLDYGVLHELAHQWWGHLAYGAYMQGRQVLNETLAQYSTFMMYKEHGSPETLRYVLRFTLDAYLNARSRETDAELPVMFNESQGYISYNKGALVIFYLQEVIGKERIHQALRNYLDRFALQGPPFPTSRDLVDAIRAQAGPEYDRLITDLFERIMFYEVAVDEGSATANAGGYSVTIPFSASQFEADGQGNLTEVPLGAWFEVVVFPVSDAPLSARTPLYRQMHFVESGQQTLTVEVGGLPAAVGIDPFHMLIDSRPGDNVASVLLR